MSAGTAAGGRAHKEAVARENALNKVYRQALAEKAGRPVTLARARSLDWTGSSPVRRPAIPQGPLGGRVALAVPDEFLGRTFYIGPWYLEADGLVVVNWDAPVAQAFYQGSRGAHPICSDVTARRTFRHQGDDIVELADDVDAPAGDADPFADTQALGVPRAPRSVPLPGRRREPPGPAPAERSAPGGLPEPRSGTETDGDPLQRGGAVGASGRAEAGQSARRRTATSGTRSPSAPLRAERILRAALAAPRTRALHPALATLQPDQYDLVTRPPAPALLVQGHPGAGKTLVAAHRGAYLVSEERDRPLARLLLLGPTQQYVDHVRGVVAPLVADAGRVIVQSVHGLAQGVARTNTRVRPSGAAADWRSSSRELAELAKRAAERIRRARSLRNPGLGPVYELLQTNGDGAPLTRDREWMDYLYELPPFSQVVASPRWALVLAICAVHLDPGAATRFDHVIVDEAQDVPPAMWSLLEALNPAGGWSVFGDENQRRTDYCYNWGEIGRVVSPGGGPARPEVVQRGYRSTAPILRFAARLLPASERRLDAVQQSGPEPSIVKVREGEVGRAVAVAVDRLLAEHPRGTVAAIGSDVHSHRASLARAGWATDKGGGPLRRGHRELHLLTPPEARGLEFDAVVVVEPLDFPANLGHHGQLYTSLTRANRELVVVHSKGLPDALRKWRPREPRGVPEAAPGAAAISRG